MIYNLQDISLEQFQQLQRLGSVLFPIEFFFFGQHHKSSENWNTRLRVTKCSSDTDEERQTTRLLLSSQQEDMTVTSIALGYKEVRRLVTKYIW